MTTTGHIDPWDETGAVDVYRLLAARGLRRNAKFRREPLTARSIRDEER